MFPLTPSPLPLLKNIRKPLIVGVVMMSLLLTLNKLDILFWCFHCYFGQVPTGFKILAQKKFKIQRWLLSNSRWLIRGCGYKLVLMRLQRRFSEIMKV